MKIKKIAIFKVNLFSAIIVLFSAILVFLAYCRIFFGIDVTDEAFYAAVPYGYALGIAPFAGEAYVYMHLPSLIIFPFIKIYLAFSGNSDGLILYLRHVYLVFNFFVAATVFFIIKKRFNWQLALPASLLPVSFCYCSIPALSYNTLGDRKSVV